LLAGDTIKPPTDQFVLSLAALPAQSGTLSPTSLTTSIPNSGELTYTAPAGFATCDSTGTLDADDPTKACTPLTFTYTLTSTGPGGATKTANVNLTVKTNSSFNNPSTGVYGKIATGSPNNCTQAACHSTSSIDCTNPANVNDSHCKWNDRGNAADTLAMLKAAACVDNNAGGHACIVPGDPSTSQMWINVCVLPANQTPPGFHTNQMAAGDCNVLSQWIADGAHLN
jgi:hypothetical protein